MRVWIWKREDGDYDWSEDYVNLIAQNSLVIIARPELSNEELKVLREWTKNEVNKVLSSYV